MNETLRRPWWRLHGVTYTILFALASSLLVLNVFGELHRFPEPDFASFGWPSTFFSREEEPTIGVAFGAGWPVKEYFWPRRLLVDVAVAISLLGSCARLIERLSRRFAIQHVSLKALLSATASVGSFLAIHKDSWEEAIVNAATAVVFLGIGGAWIAFFDVLGIVWNVFAADIEKGPPRYRVR